MSEKIGVWVIGALGSVAGAVFLGAAALKAGLVNGTGLVTELPAFQDLGLVKMDGLRFGGCDIREPLPPKAMRRQLAEQGVHDPELLDLAQREIPKIEADIAPGTAFNCGEAIQAMNQGPAAGNRSLMEEIGLIRERIRSFRQKHALHQVVVVNLASTEPLLKLGATHFDRERFEAALEKNSAADFRASSLYAYAALQEGCPYLNFTPSNGALFPAMVELAKSRGLPVMGNDGKTGETLIKSALAPLFADRHLKVLSWEGFNLLGNGDGQVLENPANKESKIKTKDQVLADILGYAPHSKVHIDYVPSLGDGKTAWDFIHFEGFLGTRMTMQFIWQGFDSLLAAPLVLDLVRLAELARRRQESGLMAHLASFFKAPLGVSQSRLSDQFRLLAEYVASIQAGTPVSEAAG